MTMVLMLLGDTGYPVSPIKEGDELVTRDGDVWVVTAGVGAPPHKPSSTGRVWVKRDDWSREFFPGVFGCKWMEAEA